MQSLNLLINFILSVVVPALKVVGPEELSVQPLPVTFHPRGQLGAGVIQRLDELIRIKLTETWGSLENKNLDNLISVNDKILY